MELEKTVDSFIQDFLQTDSYVDKELMNYRDHGWVCDIKNFHAIFEEMAKAIYHLNQNGEDAIQTLEVSTYYVRNWESDCSASKGFFRHQSNPYFLGISQVSHRYILAALKIDAASHFSIWNSYGLCQTW